MKTTVGRVLLLAALTVPAALAFSRTLDRDRQHFAPQATYQACFTPGDDCEGMIVQAINAASRRIHLQAYVFTDRAIARALEGACRRNLEVIVLFDKGQRHEPSSVAPELMQAGVEVMVDDRPRIRSQQDDHH